MKTGRFVVGVIVLSLALGGVLAVKSVVPQASGAATGFTAWMLVDFEVPDAEARLRASDLWRDAGSPKIKRDRWTRSASLCRDRREPPRPSDETVILRLSYVMRLDRERGANRRWRDANRTDQVPALWDAFVEVQGGNETEVRNAGRYIELCYTHVDIFRIHDNYQ